MTEHRGDHLIEIGDPTDDSAPEPAAGAHVVIEYRDRGLPWMLALPLLVTAAAVAIIGYKAFDRGVRPTPADPEPVAIVADATPRPPLRIIPDEVARDSSGMPLPAPSPVALPPEAIPAPVDPPPAAPPAEAAPASPFLPEGTTPGGPVETAPAPAAPLPRASEFGFDLKALEQAEVKPDGPDGVRPAANAPPVAPAPPEAEQPRAVDPKDLPRDPRQAELERYRRFLAARKERDEERTRFHAELRAIVKRFGKDAGPQIQDLCLRYGTDPDPVARVQASQKLNRAAAGVALPVRIELLRGVGWPEAGILLLDLAETQGRWESPRSSQGPRNRNDILCKAAAILLGNPPRAANPPSARAVKASATTGRR